MSLTVREIRRRWKPTKESLIAASEHEGLRVRIHRACSWLERAQEATDDLDGRLLFQWSAFSALFSRWDPDNRRPVDERESIGAFLSAMQELDAEGRIVESLDALRPLAADIFDDEFLARFFWDEPGPERADTYRRSTAMMKEWLERGRIRPALDRLFDRVWLLRSQLADGAASAGSRFNRPALERCTAFLDLILPVFLNVMIDHGRERTWDDMCYPPLGLTDPGDGPSSSRS